MLIGFAMDTTSNPIIEWFNQNFAQRKAKNRRYSKRMFARQLGISSGRLSELMNGKRALTLDLAHKMSKNLMLLPDERRQLFNLIQFTRDIPPEEINELRNLYSPLNADSFSVLADWQHFAILSLMETDDFSGDASWIAERLGILVVEAEEALLRLRSLKLIDVRNGKLIKLSENITTTQDIESLALRISHKQNLDQAISALDEVPLELRDVTSITMAIDLNRLSQAKEMIKKFRRELCAFLESGDGKHEVYNINVQLVPVSKLSRQRKSAV